MSDPSNVREQIEHYSNYSRKFENTIWTLGPRENRNHEIKISKVAQAIGAHEGGRVLEIGVGSGLHAHWLLEHTPVAYTGLDASEEMMGMARKRLKAYDGRFELFIGDAHRLPVAEGAFDATFCSGTLHHLRDPALGVHEIVRTVKPGGRVALMEPNWKFPSTLLIATFTPAERNAFKINAKRLEQWARAAGLRDVTVERVLFTPPKPETWSERFDRLDARLARTPVLKRASIMLLVSGTK